MNTLFTSYSPCNPDPATGVFECIPSFPGGQGGNGTQCHCDRGSSSCGCETMQHRAVGRDVHGGGGGTTPCLAIRTENECGRGDTQCACQWHASAGQCRPIVCEEHSSKSVCRAATCKQPPDPHRPSDLPQVRPSGHQHSSFRAAVLLLATSMTSSLRSASGGTAWMTEQPLTQVICTWVPDSTGHGLSSPAGGHCRRLECAEVTGVATRNPPLSGSAGPG